MDPKQCYRCKVIKPRDSFYQRKNSKSLGWCKECTLTERKIYYQQNRDKVKNNVKAYRESNPDSVLNTHLIRTYNITLDDYQRMVSDQDGKCLLCLSEVSSSGRQKRLHVDHDHACCSGKKSCGKCVRGVLCSSCNTALGLLKDSPELLRKSANYIENFRSQIS